MPQQRSYRLGWQSENLARFLLYKFCFVASPVQVADDIGIDFFCTLFETRWKPTNADLIPKNSFAIQIKTESNATCVDLTRYLEYLHSLELPFFVGIVNRVSLSLSVYSGELLTPFFAYKGLSANAKLRAELCERSRVIQPFDWLNETATDQYVLLFPKVASISATSTEEELEDGVKAIQASCALALNNIAAAVNRQFLFKGTAPHDVLLFAGPESLKFFEMNFIERLIEVFYNLNWAYGITELRSQVGAKFRLYESVYLALVSHFGQSALPRLLSETYKEAKNRIQAETTGVE